MMLDGRPVVRYAKIDQIDSLVVDTDRYEYRPERGWRWLQRALFKVLDWIGAHHEATVTTYTRTPQENDDLIKSLLGQEGEWIERIHRSNGARIIMGPDDHMDLLRLCEHMGMTAVHMMGRTKTADHYGSRWHNIPITVVPWMVGAVLVPNELHH